MKILYSLFVIVFLLLIINVPAISGSFTVSNVTQFQNALNTAASNGQNDTINVLAGTYNVGSTLVYNSGENYFILIRGTGSPVLEGGNARRILQLITSAGNGDIFVDGLNFQHGRGDYGGGLNAITTSADISVKNCTVNDNSANFVGGGINLGSNTGNLTITNCTFRRNTSPNTSGYPYGTAGGLFAQTDGAGTVITMTGCTFELNTAQRDAAGAMLYPLGVNSTVIAESNTFNNNNAKEAGGGCWIRSPGGNTTVRYRNNTLNGNQSSVAGSGAGTYIQITSGLAAVFDNLHTGNTAVWQGGGLWVEHGGGTLIVFRNRFANNSAGEAGGGANLHLESGTLRFFHNIFYRNTTSGIGGGTGFSTTSGVLNIINNTFFRNTASEGGDVNLYFDTPSSSSNFINNILFNSSLPALSHSGQQTVTARYCDIQGGIGQTWFGTGCIAVYPRFVDTAAGNFHLQDSLYCSHPRSSPCIDAGTPALRDSILNCSWGLRTFRSDMGAYGGKDSVSIGIKILSTEIPLEFMLFQNYPNPFNPATKIRFSLPLTEGDRGRNVRLTVYDILGREITTLVNKILSPGMYEAEWDAVNYPGGVYFYTLSVRQDGSSALDFKQTRKLVLLK